MTLTSPISHKNPTLGKVQVAQSRMRSIAQCSWAIATSQICSWCCNFSSVHFWRGWNWNETLEASGRRGGNRMGHCFILFPELSSSCWIPVVCYTSLDSQREHCILLDLCIRVTPSPMINLLQMNQRGGNKNVPPTLLCQHLSFRAGSLWKVLEHA